jgi:hypothetical protein
MSEIKYGLISKNDALTIEQTLTFVLNCFDDEIIHTAEVGIFNGQTSRGIHEFILNNGRKNIHTAVDSQKDFKTETPFEDANFLLGNSSEVYNFLKNESQHFIFIDANHSYPCAISDFFCYHKKVKVGGYISFHDTGWHIPEKTDYQKMGDVNDPDMYISVRKALTDIGLMENNFKGWQIVIDSADTNDRAGGICVLKRLL